MQKSGEVELSQLFSDFLHRASFLSLFRTTVAVSSPFLLTDANYSHPILTALERADRDVTSTHRPLH